MSKFEVVKRSQLEEKLWFIAGTNPNYKRRLEAAQILHKSLAMRDLGARAELENLLLKMLTDGPNYDTKMEAARLLHESISAREDAG